MAAALGILNPYQATGETAAGTKAKPTAQASGSDGSNTSTTDSATISANDFLTLLVTEMQNQDPTAATDPNEYINQLVNVNSLQQLIAINQNLTTALGSSTTSTAGAITGSGASSTGQSGASASPQVAGTAQGDSVTGAKAAGATKVASGNLSVPEARPAASRVANALGGRVQPH